MLSASSDHGENFAWANNFLGYNNLLDFGGKMPTLDEIKNKYNLTYVRLSWYDQVRGLDGLWSKETNAKTCVTWRFAVQPWAWVACVRVDRDYTLAKINELIFCRRRENL